MHVAVDDAGHDKFSAQVGDLALIGRKARLVAHIDELAVLYRQGRRPSACPCPL